MSQSDAPSAPVTEAAAKLDVVEFVTLVRDSPGFWAWDFPLKYLAITIDTRAGARWSVGDRDGNRIEPQRVLDAIERQRLGRLPAAERAKAVKP